MDCYTDVQQLYFTLEYLPTGTYCNNQSKTSLKVHLDEVSAVQEQAPRGYTGQSQKAAPGLCTVETS